MPVCGLFTVEAGPLCARLHHPQCTACQAKVRAVHTPPHPAEDPEPLKEALNEQASHSPRQAEGKGETGNQNEGVQGDEL